MMHSELFKGDIVSSSFSRGLCPSIKGDFAACYPSLHREDVKLWLKRYRSDYFRRYGHRVDLRYSCFGEYGSRNNRPHYHCIVYGLDDSEVKRLCSMWSFGFHYSKTVSEFNADGSNAFVKCSRYVSKYISKGEYLPGFVQDGLAEKPRRQSSIRLGLSGINVSAYRDFISPSTYVAPEPQRLKFWTLSVGGLIDFWCAENLFQCREVLNN